MCLGFNVGHIKFKTLNGYIMLTLDEEDIFWDMYQVARDMDGFKAKSYLEECKNRFLERLIEDPHILKSEMDEFFSDKKRIRPVVRKYYKQGELMDYDKMVIGDMAKPTEIIDYFRHYLLA